MASKFYFYGNAVCFGMQAGMGNYLLACVNLIAAVIMLWKKHV